MQDSKNLKCNGSLWSRIITVVKLARQGKGRCLCVSAPTILSRRLYPVSLNTSQYRVHSLQCEQYELHTCRTQTNWNAMNCCDLKWLLLWSWVVRERGNVCVSPSPTWLTHTNNIGHKNLPSITEQWRAISSRLQCQCTHCGPTTMIPQQ